MPDPVLPPRSWPCPRWIAHRGAGRLAPENTLAAFRLGAAHGWRAFECDVQLSADGEAFLLHDATLERTTDGNGIAGQQTWAELQRLDAGSWHSPAHAGEPLPPLQGVAAFCLASGLALNIELKPSPGEDDRTGRTVARLARDLWQTHVAGGRSAWPLLSSFRLDALAAAQAAAPDLPRALLLDELTPDCFDTAARLGCCAVVLDHRLIQGPDLVRAEHAAGRQVLVYTVNDTARARELLDWGVSGVISDAIDRMGPGTDHG